MLGFKTGGGTLSGTLRIAFGLRAGSSWLLLEVDGVGSMGVAVVGPASLLLMGICGVVVGLDGSNNVPVGWSTHFSSDFC